MDIRYMCMQPKKHKDKLTAQPGCELFLLTVPTKEVARCQYKTVQIIFPLNLPTQAHTLLLCHCTPDRNELAPWHITQKKDIK